MCTSAWMWVNAALAAAEQAAESGAAASETAQQSPFGNMWIFFVLFIGVMWFLMIRPEQKRKKERLEMLAALAKGDEVITTGGVCGTIVGLNEKTVVLRVSEDPPVKIEFVRGAVTRVSSRGGDDDK